MCDVFFEFILSNQEIVPTIPVALTAHYTPNLTHIIATFAIVEDYLLTSICYCYLRCCSCHLSVKQVTKEGSGVA